MIRRLGTPIGGATAGESTGEDTALEVACESAGWLLRLSPLFDVMKGSGHLPAPAAPLAWGHWSGSGADGLLTRSAPNGSPRDSDRNSSLDQQLLEPVSVAYTGEMRADVDVREREAVPNGLCNLMTFAQRSNGESRQKTSEYLEEDVRPMLLCWANVRSTWTGLPPRRELYITVHGRSYHRAGCRRCRGAIFAITHSEAAANRLRPCRVCRPDQLSYSKSVAGPLLERIGGDERSILAT